MSPREIWIGAKLSGAFQLVAKIPGKMVGYAVVLLANSVISRILSNFCTSDNLDNLKFSSPLSTDYPLLKCFSSYS